MNPGKQKISECLICCKTFRHLANFKRHEITMHNQKDKISGFSCDVCNKSLANNSSLKKHKKMVHDKLRYRCDICSKDFSANSSLSVHKKAISKKDKSNVNCVIKNLCQK